MRDHRKSSRHATSAASLRCELILGPIVLPAMLLNESAKGFGVLVGGMPSIAPNQSAHLHNYRGWFDCQIVYAMEVIPATTAIYKAVGVGEEFKDVAEEDEDGPTHITAYDIDKFVARTTGPWFRLGIRSLHELRSSASPASVPVECGSLGLLQSLKSLCASFFER
jgi:hypothetical protein